MSEESSNDRVGAAVAALDLWPGDIVEVRRADGTLLTGVVAEIRDYRLRYQRYWDEYARSPDHQPLDIENYMAELGTDPKLGLRSPVDAANAGDVISTRRDAYGRLVDGSKPLRGGVTYISYSDIAQIRKIDGDSR